jgi:outer membrane lipoprotein-sorting protein
MRKVLAVALTVVVVFLVVRSGVLNRDRASTSPSPIPTGDSNASDSTPTSAPTLHPGGRASDPSSSAPTEPPRPSDSAVAAVMDEMLARWKEFDSAYATLTMFIPHALGHSGNTIGNGKYWIQKKEGPLRLHFEMVNEYRIKQDAGSLLVTGEELLTVIDGKHTYTLLNQPSNRSAKKMNLTYDDVLHLGGPHLWRDLVALNKLTPQPEEMRGSFATRVIKAEPRDGSRTTLNYFDKATGLRVALIELDEHGQTSLEIKVAEIQINPAISSEQFNFVTPPGYKLDDLTKPP